MVANVLSDNSTLAREYTKTHGRIARDVMTREVISIAPTALADIAKTLERNRIKRVPVRPPLAPCPQQLKPIRNYRAAEKAYAGPRWRGCRLGARPKGYF